MTQNCYSEYCGDLGHSYLLRRWYVAVKASSCGAVLQHELVLPKPAEQRMHKPTTPVSGGNRRMPRTCTGRWTAADHLDKILTWREVRTVTNNLTLHYDLMMLLLNPTPFARGLARKKVDVVNYPDGRFTVQFEGFVSERVQPLTRQGVNYLVAAAAKRAGLSGIHPHTLRRSCGFALADKGHDLRLIQDYLGHRDPRHTVHYTRTAGRRFEGLWR